MLPTIEVRGDWIVLDRSARNGRGVEVGDIVSFKSLSEPGVRMMKRVIGMPGDFVMRDTPGSGSNAMFQVPAGHCWVVGDNMSSSRDSRTLGPVPLALVRGKAVAKIWPWSERKWFENPLKPVEM